MSGFLVTAAMSALIVPQRFLLQHCVWLRAALISHLFFFPRWRMPAWPQTHTHRAYQNNASNSSSQGHVTKRAEEDVCVCVCMRRVHVCVCVCELQAKAVKYAAVTCGLCRICQRPVTTSSSILLPPLSGRLCLVQRPREVFQQLMQ